MSSKTSVSNGATRSGDNAFPPFKRLMEIVADTGVLLSVPLVGHPRLRNDLRRPQMEETGYSHDHRRL